MSREAEKMNKIIALAKNRGFIFPGSDIYGGLANSYDFGPLGSELKKNIKDLWWKTFVRDRKDIVGIDANIIMNPKIWEASGHIDSFTDPLVEDKKTHVRYRADHLLEDAEINASGMTLEEMGKIIGKKGIKSPDGNELTTPKQFNLMFKTFMGPVEDKDSIVHLRPETAQAMFVDFAEVLRTSRKSIPFGIAQIGKAFRNEITTGNFIFRLREFEQMEIEYFIAPPKSKKDWEKHFNNWLEEIRKWLDLVGIDRKLIKEVDVPESERAHYSERTVDIEFEYPFGQKELYGLAYRTNYDLSQHEKSSGKSLKYKDLESGEEYIPHVIEPSMGVERTILAILVSSYKEEKVKGETRVVLALPKTIAPFKVAVLPLSKKEELQKLSEDIRADLSKSFVTDYDETQSIGKRYRRQDEIGTPFCVTVDFDSLEDKMVTVRDRDSMKQERVAIDELESYLKEKLS
ncbi:MAG: glycine--tRNA ligase [Candidatus Colwellbacteria bacterium CG10_big_fil_rev_8_21_14_0_10_41_28]|uniref:Glycine--tRNA ligase n=1 Tax=Candidatus Colwellbacteria bacterium CG10_big_fil_rev_8_21_14_0_10_41_28 TaxID=1974539 RepID=A0A2H0VHZ3_9BACT|nr:MAG: glycine--tRNA ligase [Candidatus Colwellbacteria bacterium CG10_big_fil_rev_8_21_14_0_10_41_28]